MGKEIARWEKKENLKMKLREKAERTIVKKKK